MRSPSSAPLSGAVGLLAIGGPPLGGKSVLAAALADVLPNAIRLEATDDLSREAPYWVPESPDRRPVSRPGKHLLERARRVWRQSSAGRRPTLIVVTRFGTAADRRRAKVYAALAGMPFLFVEAIAADAQALRRIPARLLEPRELELRLRRYERARRAYAPLRRPEAMVLPGLSVRRVLSDLDASLTRVLSVWGLP